MTTEDQQRERLAAATFRARDRETVRLRPGDAFWLGFWAAVGAMLACGIVSVTVYLIKNSTTW